MALDAATKVLHDAGRYIQSICVSSAINNPSRTDINCDAVETASVDFCYGDSTSGQVFRLNHS